jgi:hypothetical protein
VLALLGDRLAGSRTTLRIGAGILFPEEMASRLLSALRAPAAANACVAFEARARALAAAGQPIVLALDDGDCLLPQTAHWLATLTEPAQPAVQVVVACQSEVMLRRSFPPGIGRIDVVRLAEIAAPAASVSRVERPHPQAATPHRNGEPAASTELQLESRDPVAIAAGRVPDVALRRSPRPRRLLASSIALLTIGFAGGVSLASISALLSRSPPRIDPQTATPQQEPPSPRRARAPVKPPDPRPGAELVRERSSAASGRLDVLYDASRDRIRVSARGVPLWELLTLIAWQTGLRVDSNADLSERVDARFEDVSLEEALGRLLEGYHTIALGTPEPGEPSPRSLWVLMERSESPQAAKALESVLQSDDPTLREDAARRLESQGSAAAAYALVDALWRAEASGVEESRFLAAVRGRVSDCLCRAWAGSAVGPRANSLRCS